MPTASVTSKNRLLLALVTALVATSAQPSHAIQKPAIVTFARDVAPIIYANCATCHHPNGSAPFSLVRYADVRPKARAIADAVRRRTMPPWPPAPAHGGPFIGERRLSEQQIAVVTQWVENGAPEGDEADLPTPPAWDDGWTHGTPDLIVRMPLPYTLHPSGRDRFRIFVLPVPLTEARYVVGVDLRPSNRAVTHHANIRIDRTGTSQRLDDEDPEPGYEGFTASTAAFPDGQFLGWTPGQEAPFLPKDMAWRLSPGSSFVVQLHLMPTDRPEVVDFQLGLYFGDRPAVRAPVMLRLGRQDIDIPAGTKSYTITDSYLVPVDVDVEALQPHAHYLATKIRASASLPDGTTRWLLEIPDWDFHWQDVYRLRTPLRLPRGTTVTMQYTYDNSSGNRNNPASPPMPVHYGQQTVNEMGDFWIQMLPVRLVDRPVLLRSVLRKSSDEDIAGYKFLLGETPTDPMLHTGLGKAYLTTGRTAEGISELREALRFAPGLAQTHANLASALLSDGKTAEAEAQFREAVRLEPKDIFAQNGIGLVLLASGQPEKAVALFRTAVQLDPNDPQGHNNLGIALQRIGHAEEVISEYRESVRLAVDSAAVTFNLANALRAQNRLEEAIEAYRQTLELDPTEIRAAVALGKSLEVKRCDASAISSYRRALELAPRDTSSTIRLAWLLATTPDPTWRDPREALELASLALSMSPSDPEVLDVYAAANAAAGAYEAAIQAAERALTIRGLSTSATLSADEISERLKLYRRHQPFVMALPPASATQC